MMVAAHGLSYLSWVGIGFEKCPIRGVFQINVTSGYYSQAAGAMAGLCFAALALLVGAGERDPHAPRRNSDALLTLFVTLFAFIITMIEYSVLAGTQALDGRAAAGELVAGLSFVFAVSMLFHALGLLLEVRPEYARVTNVARWVSVVVIPVTGLLFLVMGSQDAELIRSRPSAQGAPAYCDGSLTMHVGAALTGLIMLCLITLKVIGWRAAWARSRRSLVPIGVLLWTVVSLFFFGFLSIQPLGFVAPRWADMTFLACAGCLLFVTGIVIQAAAADRMTAACRENRKDSVIESEVSENREEHALQNALKDRRWVVILMSPRRSRTFRSDRGRRQTGTD